MKLDIENVLKNHNKKRKQKIIFGIVASLLSCIVCCFTIYFFSKPAATQTDTHIYKLILIDNYYLISKGVSSTEELESIRTELKEKETTGILETYISELQEKEALGTLTEEEQKILNFHNVSNWKDSCIETYLDDVGKTIEKSKSYQKLDLLYVDTNNNPIDCGTDITLSIGPNSTDNPDNPYGFGIVPYTDTSLQTHRGEDLIVKNNLNTLIDNNQAKYIFDHVEVLDENGIWIKINEPEDPANPPTNSLYWNLYCNMSSASSAPDDLDRYGWSYTDRNNKVYRINGNTKYKLVYKLIRQGTDTVSSEALSSNLGVTFKLFNYDMNVNKNGLEQNNAFLFRDTLLGVSSINAISDEDGFTENHATVLKELGEDGYPIFDSKGQATGVQNTSLGYLYGAATNPLGQSTVGVTQYEPTNTLLKNKNFDGINYYYYNSSENAVDYNTDNNTFMLRNYKERGETLVSSYPNEVSNDSSKEQRYEFFPFNYKTTSKSQYSNNGISYDYKRAEVDYWFGMTMEFNFFMPKDGLIESEDGSTAQDMIFEFSGDDDVWVFIDDVLVLDLGGTHGAVDGKINFATGEVYSELNWNGQKKYGSTTNIKTLFEGTTKYDEIEWNGNTFDINSLHKVNFFYLERGAAVSNCKIKFNMPILPPGELSVKKEIEGETNNVSETYEFILYDTTNGTPIPVTNTSYTVNNKNYTTDNNGCFKLKADETAKFKLVNTHIYYVEETNSGLNYEPSNCILNGKKCTSIKKTDTFKVDYTSAHYAVFTNKRSNVDIKITKDVLDEDKLAEFDFELVLKDELGNSVIPTYKDDSYNIEQETGKIIFKLRHNESVIIKCIPKGVKATLKEVQHDGYTTLIKENNITLSNHDTYDFTINENRSIVVNNIPDIELPETGSSSELTMLLAGIVLMIIPFVYKYKKRSF